MSYQDSILMFKTILKKTVDGTYSINAKDVVNLEKTLQSAYTAMNKSEIENKRLKSQSTILETECDALRVILNETISNLCLEFDRRVEKFSYIQEEKNKLKHIFDNQLLKIQEESSNRYNEVINAVNKLKEEIIVKNTTISDLTNDIYLANAKTNEKYANEQIVQKKLSIDLTNINNELYEGKCLISGHISQMEGQSDIDIKNYRLSELIGMFTTSFIKLKDNEKNKTINGYNIIMDNLRKENEHFKISIEKYKHQLLNEAKQCVEQKQNELSLKNKYEQATAKIEKLTYKMINLNNQNRQLEDSLKEKSSQMSSFEQITNIKFTECANIITKLSKSIDRIPL
ncbi:Hypothetical protein CINCED_3A005292 [Cinara cedri]|uniref:Uncharacterized protein n=1 Tax=Cinara cedri TaxID=506608 RepID=A0A5E4NDU9_9HEMI|nr:Hypothetical protein CINCED_3A005292 [Cinara cedri]